MPTLKVIFATSICTMYDKISNKTLNCELWKNWKCDVTWSWPPLPPVTNCHTFSDPPPWSVTYFMDGPKWTRCASTRNSRNFTRSGKPASTWKTCRTKKCRGTTSASTRNSSTAGESTSTWAPCPAETPNTRRTLGNWWTRTNAANCSWKPSRSSRWASTWAPCKLGSCTTEWTRNLRDWESSKTGTPRHSTGILNNNNQLKDLFLWFFKFYVIENVYFYVIFIFYVFEWY